MLTSVHAGLLVELGRQIELGFSPDLPAQLSNLLRKIFFGGAVGHNNAPEIAASLSEEEVVFFFKALIHYEKKERVPGISVSPITWVFINIKDRMPERSDELLDWALKNRGQNEYTPVGHITAARSLEEYKIEQQEKCAGRARRHLQLEAEKAEVKKRRRQKKDAHQERIQDGTSRAKGITTTLEELAALSPPERLRALSINEFPLEALPMELIDKEKLEELSSEELRKLFSRIDQRRGKWGSVAKFISGILERR